MRTELLLGPKWEPTDRRVYFEVVSDGRRCACSMRLPYPTANEAVSFFRDNWNWIKDRVQDRIDDGQFNRRRSRDLIRAGGFRRPAHTRSKKRLQFKMFPALPLQALPEASTFTGMPTPEECYNSLICQRHSAR